MFSLYFFQPLLLDLWIHYLFSFLYMLTARLLCLANRLKCFLGELQRLMSPYLCFPGGKIFNIPPVGSKASSLLSEPSGAAVLLISTGLSQAPALLLGAGPHLCLGLRPEPWLSQAQPLQTISLQLSARGCSLCRFPGGSPFHPPDKHLTLKVLQC